MGSFIPVPKHKFQRWLKRKFNIIQLKSSKHEIYDNPAKPLLRPITLHHGYDSVPPLHIKTSLSNINRSYGLNISLNQFMTEIRSL